MFRLMTAVFLMSMCAWSADCITRTLTKNVHIQHKILHKVDDRFLSVALGPILIRLRWYGFNTSCIKVQTLAKALGPCILRFGGNNADFLIFDPEGQHSPLPTSQLDEYEDSNFTMTSSDFDILNEFAAKAGWKLLFDFNALLRKGTRWDSTNAKEILLYAIKQDYAGNIYMELGNEMNHIMKHWGKSLDAAQYAEDFMSLCEMIRSDPEFSSAFSDSHLVAPDVTRPVDHPHGNHTLGGDSMNYLKKYLNTLSGNLSAITWHQYYVNGRNTSLEDFTRPEILNLFPRQVAMVNGVVRDTHYAGHPVWLGETSSAYGGGAPGLSDTYVAGFLWLDKLGVAARDGVSVVIRQTLYYSYYALLDDFTMDPRPDYWLSLLYKKLVGREVLNATVSENKSTRLRVYAHCTNTERSGHPAGSVTVYALNLHDDAVNITVEGVNMAHGLAQYLLTPHESPNLQSKNVRLNGRKLSMIDDATLPKMPPRILPSTSPLQLPPKTFGFFVLLKALPEIC